MVEVCAVFCYCLLWLDSYRDNRCMYMVYVCCVAAFVKNSVFLNLGVLKYVVCLCRGCDGCCVFCLYCETWNYRYSCIESVSVSSCRCCMFVCIL